MNRRGARRGCLLRPGKQEYSGCCRPTTGGQAPGRNLCNYTPDAASSRRRTEWSQLLHSRICGTRLDTLIGMDVQRLNKFKRLPSFAFIQHWTRAHGSDRDARPKLARLPLKLLAKKYTALAEGVGEPTPGQAKGATVPPSFSDVAVATRMSTGRSRIYALMSSGLLNVGGFLRRPSVKAPSRFLGSGWRSRPGCRIRGIRVHIGCEPLLPQASRRSGPIR